jgi:hypothetical protein
VILNAAHAEPLPGTGWRQRRSGRVALIRRRIERQGLIELAAIGFRYIAPLATRGRGLRVPFTSTVWMPLPRFVDLFDPAAPESITAAEVERRAVVRAERPSRARQLPLFGRSVA